MKYLSTPVEDQLMKNAERGQATYGAKQAYNVHSVMFLLSNCLCTFDSLL